MKTNELWAARASPIGAEGIEKILRAVDGANGLVMVNHVDVGALTASVIAKVYRGLPEPEQAKFQRLPVYAAADLAWKCVDKGIE